MVTRKITRIACCSAILFLSQIALRTVPNVELVSFLVIMFTLTFGRETLLTVTVFALLETTIYGLGMWTVNYFYIWAVLVGITLWMKDELKDSVFWWAIVSMVYGLLFGALCSLVYIPFGLTYVITWWVAGLKFDLIHGVGNFVVMVALYKPVIEVLRRIRKELYADCR